MVFFNVFIVPHDIFGANAVNVFENNLIERNKAIEQNKYDFNCDFEKILHTRRAIAEHEIKHYLTNDIYKSNLLRTGIPLIIYIAGSTLLPELGSMAKITLGLGQMLTAAHLIAWWQRRREREADDFISNKRSRLQGMMSYLKDWGDPEQSNLFDKILDPQHHDSKNKRIAALNKRLQTAQD